MCKAKAACARRQSGLSLIELMVALVIGLIFAIAVLVVQSKLTQQNLQMTDVMERDTQARAALDIITRYLTNAGFMINGVHAKSCDALLTYNSTLNPPISGTPPSPVAAANQPLSLPVNHPPTGTNDNPSDYPPAGSGNVSQLVTIRSIDTALLPPGASQNVMPTSIVLNSVAKAPSGQGALHATKLPLFSTAGMNSGDTAQLRMQLNGNMVCFQAPIVTVATGTTPYSNYITSLDPQFFPPDGYAGFQTSMRNQGLLLPGQVLSNGNFVGATLVDLGPQANTVQRLDMFYVANSTNAAGNPLPMLMHASATVGSKGNVLNAPPAPVAAGIVSLQALFGVDETNAGAVTNYLSWDDVVSSGYTADVRSVLFALVSRSLQANPSSPAVTKVAVPSPVDHGGFGPDKFTDFVPDAASQHYRYTVIESEVALRNLLWLH